MLRHAYVAKLTRTMLCQPLKVMRGDSTLVLFFSATSPCRNLVLPSPEPQFYLLTRGFNWELELNMKVAQPLLKVRGTPRAVVGGIKNDCFAARVWQNSLERCCGSSSQSLPYLITCLVTLAPRGAWLRQKSCQEISCSRSAGIEEVSFV